MQEKLEKKFTYIIGGRDFGRKHLSALVGEKETIESRI